MPVFGLLSLALAVAGVVLLLLLLWQWRRSQVLAQALARSAAPIATPPPPGNLFAQMGDAVHEVVLLYKDVILYANPLFARLAGAERVNLVGRQLTAMVAPEEAELVADHIARCLAGDEAAPRFEVDVIGGQGQQSRLELTATRVDFENGKAVLLTGMEVIPTMSTTAVNAGTGLFETLGAR
jgi:PAS domain S-box-containing protein